MKGLEHLFYEERLRVMDLFSLEKVQSIQVPDRRRWSLHLLHLPVVPTDRARDNLYKLQKHEIPSEHEKIISNCESDLALAQVSQKVCGISLLGDFQKPKASKAVCMDQMSSRSLFQPQLFCDSVNVDRSNYRPL